MLNIYKISRMTMHNGPGIRTLVHLKGCPLTCVWCSAPESQEGRPELGFRRTKCIGCKACINVCERQALSAGRDGKAVLNREKCNQCFACVEECYCEALTKVGTFWEPEELVKELKKDEAFFRRSKGGVTFSGGEPLMHMNGELISVFVRLKEEGISVGVDTTGCVSYENIHRILPFTDFFLWDLKQMDNELHRKYTGTGNELIIENLKKTDKESDAQGTDIYIRCPIIPGMTDSDKHLKAVCRLVKGLKSVREIHLLPFHQLGRERYEFCGKEYGLMNQSLLPAEVMEQKQQLVKSCGISCRIIG